jgi:hypothetical protein
MRCHMHMPGRPAEEELPDAERPETDGDEAEAKD